MWKFTRKGQMEIMGLVIVVILISLGMLFLLKFVVFQPVGDDRATFTRSKLATNTLGSLLNTVTDCKVDGQVTFSDLIQDCAEYKKCDDERTSCDFLEEEIKAILDDTLKNWNKNYILTIKRGTQNVEMISPIFNGDCLGDKDAGVRHLRTKGRDLVTIQLDVCS